MDRGTEGPSHDRAQRGELYLSIMRIQRYPSEPETSVDTYLEGAIQEVVTIKKKYEA